MRVPRSDNLILKWYPNETAMEAGADMPRQKYPRPLMNDSIFIYTYNKNGVNDDNKDKT